MLYIEKLYLNILFINSKKRCKKSQFCILAFFNSVLVKSLINGFCMLLSFFCSVTFFILKSLARFTVGGSVGLSLRFELFSWSLSSIFTFLVTVFLSFVFIAHFSFDHLIGTVGLVGCW